MLLVRLFDGKLKVPTRVRLMHSDAEHKVEEVGNQTLKRVPVPELSAGEVGYVLAGMKSLAGLAIGDTLTEADRPAAEPVPGYREAKPVVFSSLYPMSTDDYEELTKALEKLKLNDASLIYEKDSSAALGFGFRCGFLGLLHLDVVQARLEREYDLSLILSAPSVRYRIVLNDDNEVWIDNPSFYPDPTNIKEAYEPYIKAAIMTPERYLGTVMELCRERRGVETTYSYLAAGRMEVTSQLPLAEVLFDFYDRLKSITQGYGSFDYEMLDYRLGRHGEGGHPRQQREGRCPVAARPPGVLAPAGAALLRAAGQEDPAPAVQDRHPGRDRRPDHRPLHHQPLPQGRDGQVLRRRHQPQAQAPREAEGRQEEDEDGGERRDPPVRLRVRAQDRGRRRRRVGPGCISTFRSARRSARTATSR